MPKKLIDKTSFAMSLEETRYYLNGIYMHALKEGNKLRTVSTVAFNFGLENIR